MKRICLFFFLNLFFLSQQAMGNRTNFLLQDSLDQIDWEEAQMILNPEEIFLAQDKNFRSETEILEDIKDFFQLFPKVMASKIATIHFYKRIQEKLKRHKAFTGREIRSLQSHIYEKLTLRYKLLKFVDSYYPSMIAFESSPKERLMGTMLMLSSVLLLLDGYSHDQKFFVENDRLRRILNEQSNSKYKDGDFLNSILKFKNLNFVFKKIHAIRFIDRRQDEIKNLYANDEEIQTMMKVISLSKSYQLYQTLPFGNLLREIIAHFTEAFWLYTFKITDRLQESISSISYTVSKVFGNAVGKIAWRSGILKNNKKVLSKMKNILSPMDVLVEKTPFRLTDQFIPGHWGHVAVWIGQKEELQKLGLWEHPLVKRYKNQIIKGHGVVEALRAGVKINPLEGFLNVDSLAVIRHKGLLLEEKKEAILYTLKQIGKQYDFNFDLETQASLVCSELVYISFADIEWQTHGHFGRFEILPDDIAKEALEGGKFDLEYFVHNGLEFENRLQALKIFKSVLKN